jgi:hypothetical protein
MGIFTSEECIRKALIFQGKPLRRVKTGLNDKPVE